ncbi:uncharacterized protein LOC123551070 isoform X5 [Mercenaria mercenaria]|uniref:uncharacterized protein LOC123551070 isoform X5 n=1 Tax=Mercenaria mercenaria TaxID=6596 RepID=UPI00234EE53D|nr:uncharacterized protein LOC123551070 isoform X5 [Mercenaria mercenaria]
MDIPLFNSEVKKLRKNNKELTAELTDIEKQYKDVYKVAEDWLRHIYMTCQRQFVLWRYWNLKDMIKDYKDIEKLKTKEEVETDIELKLERKKELEKRIRRLKELGMKYQISKQHYPHRRYEELKSIIKEITRD